MNARELIQKFKMIDGWCAKKKSGLTMTKTDLAEYSKVEQQAEAKKCTILSEYHQAKIKEVEAEITRLQEKYDENGYNSPPLIKLQRIEQHIDMALKTHQAKIKEGAEESKSLKVLANILRTALYKKKKLEKEHGGGRVSPALHIQLHKNEATAIIKEIAAFGKEEE